MEAWSGANATSGTGPRVGGGGDAGQRTMYAEFSGSGNHSNLSSQAVNISSNATPGDGGNTLLQFYLYEQLLAHPDIRMRDELLRYVTPALVIFGNFTNFLAFIILRRKNMRQHSVCFYMAAYALANILVLNLILGIAWLCFVLEKPYIGAISDWGCRLWTFLSNVIIYCGIWFVVVLTIDRFIYLCYAHKAITYCTVFAAKAITLMVLIGLVVVSIHAMWTFELQPQGCFVSYAQDDLHIKIWPLWSATVYSYLPLTLLLFINVVLSVSLCLKRHRQRRSQSIAGTDDFAITTLVISSAFFLLTVPATVINVVDIYFPMSWLSLDLIAEIELTKKITEILSSANQTLLGVILLIFSKAFREELFSIAHSLRLKRRPKVYEMGNVANVGNAERGGAAASTTANGASANGRTADATTSSRSHIEYEVCNSSDITTV